MLPIHILWVNLVTDSFPAIALGIEKPEKDIMNRKPRKSNERIFANGEIIYDGNKGIGRIPGHPFTSSIIGGRIIANEIQKMKFEEIYDITKFDIEKKIVQYFI